LIETIKPLKIQHWGIFELLLQLAMEFVMDQINV
jgi:hypothetical protein